MQLSIHLSLRPNMGRLLVCLIGGVSGCTVGPDYHMPRPPVPSSYVNPSAPPTTQTSVTEAAPVEGMQWWRNFQDPVLDSLVARAVDANLDVRHASARLRQARAQRGVTASSLFPQIHSSGSYTHSGSGGGGSSSFVSPSGAVSTKSTGTSRDFYIAGFDATWEIDVFGGVRRSVESADAGVVAAVEDRRDVLVTLLAEVASNYITLRQLQQEIVIAHENLISDQHIADLTRKKFGAGFAAQLDVANAAAQVAATQSQIPALETAAQQQIYALSVLLAQEPGALLGELSEPRPIPLTPPRVPIGMPSDLLRRRSDIRRSEAQLHAATASIGIATADLFPRFSLTGNFDMESSKLKALGNWSSSIWNFGPNVTWPLFAGGRIRANIEVQNALQEQALLTYDQTILNALRDVENALVAYAKEQQRSAALVDSVKFNRQSLDLSTRLYNAGLTEFLNVLNAQRSLNASQDALAQSAGAVAIDLAALYKALGGGWELSGRDAIAFPAGPGPSTWPTTEPIGFHRDVLPSVTSRPVSE